MASLLRISEVNAIDKSQFEAIFANVIELCTDAAVQVQKRRPFKNVAALCEEFANYLDGLSEAEKVVVLKLHPDLAGRLAAQGELTRESTQEQRSAGLLDLTAAQKAAINVSNEVFRRYFTEVKFTINLIIPCGGSTQIRYKGKFGFPFIICARENKIQSILDGLKQRCNNTSEQEIKKGIEEVKKICTLRIFDIVKDD